MRSKSLREDGDTAETTSCSSEKVKGERLGSREEIEAGGLSTVDGVSAKLLRGQYLCSL